LKFLSQSNKTYQKNYRYLLDMMIYGLMCIMIWMEMVIQMLY